MFAEFEQLGSQLGGKTLQLWEDARHFFSYCNTKAAVASGDRERLLRAAVIMASAAFEAWTNFLAERIVRDGQVSRHKLTETEADFLREKQKRLENGKIIERSGKYSSTDRFLLLCRIVSGADPSSSLCDCLRCSFETRDHLVHPKPGSSGHSLNSKRAESAYLGFLAADIFLAKAWFKAQSNTPRPILVRS